MNAENHTDAPLRSADDIHPYGQNPKEHPPEQVDKIADSIRRFGWDQPIVVDGEGVIIKGHGRLKAAQQIDLEHVPAVVRDDLSDAEKRAARIADNKVAESGWDDDLLAVEVELLEESDIAAEASGLDSGEVSSLTGDPPDFGPVPEDEQPRLDESDADGGSGVSCPQCGHEFDP